jgi:hypothetical protein
MQMRYHINRKRLVNIFSIVLVFLTTFSAMFYWWSSSDGIETYREYLLVIKEPYQILYTNLESLPDHPTKAEVYHVYNQFNKNINTIKISSNAEMKVKENYELLLSMPETFKEDYDQSNYKYSTLIGQSNHAKMVVDYIEGN